MTAEQIKKVSLKYFAQNGYEGASLAQIADDVGIKKQSIYTHFNGKDELFLRLCRDAYEHELNFVTGFIGSNAGWSIKEFLYEFLIRNIDRYEKDESTRFWLRTAFFPPSHLYSQVIRHVYEYLDQLEIRLLPVLKQAAEKGEISSAIGEQSATVAYLGLLDGIFVEMIYGSPERVQKRLDASWHVYWHGLSRK